jgi:hypothetical protein
MRVVANKVGFDGRKIRQPGEEFDMPEGSKGSWFAPAQKAESKKTKEVAETGKDLV